MKLEEVTYRTWQEFEQQERRRVGTFQLSVDDLAKDMYADLDVKSNKDTVEELNFDY